MRNHVTERKGKRRSRAPCGSEVSRLRSDTAHNRREIRLYHCYNMSGSESSIGVGSRRRTCPVLLTYTSCMHHCTSLSITEPAQFC